MLTSIKHTLAALKMPAKMGDKIIKAQTIQSKLTGNANFTAPWPTNVITLMQLGTDVNALVAAETAVKNKTGTAAARNTALVVVMTDLRNILTMVQLKADSNTANASAIILSAGYKVRQTSIKQKQTNDAKNTQVLGTVLLTADGGGHHEWQMSKDKVTITTLPSTSTAHTFVTGLKTGDVWFFRNHKVNTAKTTYNWCPWIELTVGSGGKNTGKGNTAINSGSLPTA